MNKEAPKHFEMFILLLARPRSSRWKDHGVEVDQFG